MAFVHNRLIVLLQRDNGNLNRRQMFFEFQHDTAVASAQILFFVSLGHNGQNAAVNTHGRLNDEGNNPFVAVVHNAEFLG